jgi:hypothetical protein
MLLHALRRFLRSSFFKFPFPALIDEAKAETETGMRTQRLLGWYVVSILSTAGSHILSRRQRVFRPAREIIRMVAKYIHE